MNVPELVSIDDLWKHNAVALTLTQRNDFATCIRYADAMESGDVFPPIELDGLTIVDGIHRTLAVWLTGEQHSRAVRQERR
jgi:hypothetical protein